MKLRLLSFTLLAALLADGCAKNETSPAVVNSAASSAPAANVPVVETSKAPAPTPAASAAAAAKGSARAIEITANDQMKFSVTTIEAKAGEQLKIVFTNAGTLPKEAMGHNWVLLQAGTDAAAFSAAAITAKDKDYIPDSMKDKVIAHTALLGPKKTEEVVFTVPAAGEYPFLCSFPAHYAVGMKGTLIVK
jgi:azurin